MVSNILNVLSEAIRTRQCLAICYRGQRQMRVIEPHVLYTSDSGELVLDAYQIRGYSEGADEAPFWESFRLRHISSISIMRQSFDIRLDAGFDARARKYRNGLLASVIFSQSAHPGLYDFGAPATMLGQVRH